MQGVAYIDSLYQSQEFVTQILEINLDFSWLLCPTLVDLIVVHDCALFLYVVSTKRKYTLAVVSKTCSASWFSLRPKSCKNTADQNVTAVSISRNTSLALDR